MGMFWQIKIEPYTSDNELIGTCWLDRFSNSWDADTFIREFCKLCDMWKLIDDEGSIRARKDNKDGTSVYSYDDAMPKKRTINKFYNAICEYIEKEVIR